MKVRGEVFSGAFRGEPLIEKYHARLIGLVGFRPLKGTMDVRLGRNVDIRQFTSKSMDQVLADGKKKVTAYLTPVRIKKVYTHYKMVNIEESEKQILDSYNKLSETAKVKFSIDTEPVNEETYECWAVQFKNGLYDTTVIELISKDHIKDTLEIKDGDKVEIEFLEAKGEIKPVGKKLYERLKFGKGQKKVQQN